MRRLIFAAIVSVLLGALVLVALGHRGTPLSGHKRPASASVGSASPDAPAPAPTVRPEVRRFLAAFLTVEAGEDTPRTRKALRATSGRNLAKQILNSPRATDSHPPTSGHVLVLRLRPLPGHLGMLLASGTAARPQGQEPFSFLFARRAGRWLAIAPGE